MKDKLYYNAEMKKVATLDDWRDMYRESRLEDEESDFKDWKSEYLTDIDDLEDYITGD